jgi:hypothetical protein
MQPPGNPKILLKNIPESLKDIRDYDIAITELNTDDTAKFKGEVSKIIKVLADNNNQIKLPL